MNESTREDGPQPVSPQPETGSAELPPQPASPAGGPSQHVGGAGPQEQAAAPDEQEQSPGEQTPDAPSVAPLGVTRTPTGNAGIDACMERLADLDHLPAHGHIEVYEDVHRGLRDTLAALDNRPGPPAPAGPHGHRS